MFEMLIRHTQGGAENTSDPELKIKSIIKNDHHDSGPGRHGC